MPWPGPLRPRTSVRFSVEEFAAIDARALAEGLTIRGGEPNRSEMIRRLTAYGMAYMPEGWTPEGTS